MPKIRVLEKQVAELIAAGEVVERPASVIKELIENTIDAGATHVTVEIRGGGAVYMRVTDDGCGIAREDVPTAFLRHATSKVHTADDLTGISTLGFRGEALASVAAVARVEMTTRTAEELAGTHYVIHGGEEVATEDTGCPVGTTVIVKDLFYNVPARQKFLKKETSESNAVAAIVERLSLSHTEVSFRFIRDDRTELLTPGDGDLLNAIHAVFGKQFAAGLIPVNYENNGIAVSGYIGKPEASRTNRTMQHFFINGRYVRTQTAQIATERAYKGALMVGRFPTCVLCLTMSPELFDANVHPAKIEIRFADETPVFNTVYAAVQGALEGRTDMRRVLLQDERTAQTPQTKPATPPLRPRPEAVTGKKAAPTPPPRYTVLKPAEPPHRTRSSFLDVTVDDDRPVEGAMHDDSGRFPKPSFTAPAAVAPEKPAPMPSAPAVETPVKPQTQNADLLPKTGSVAVAQQKSPEIEEQLSVLTDTAPVRILGEAFTTYIVAEQGSSLFLIDKHAAHERILYNELIANAHADQQMLLCPVAVTLSREEYAAVLESIDELATAGFEIEDFGGSSVLVRSMPLILSGTDAETTLREIAGGLASGSREITTAKLEWIYHSAACRAAIKAGDHSRPEDWETLVKRVLLDRDIRTCPHGRPVCIELTRKDLEKQFGRVQ